MTGYRAEISDLINELKKADMAHADLTVEAAREMQLRAAMIEHRLLHFLSKMNLKGAEK